jgi:peptidoglycan hydrolase-like protein with peptidoglycan-binding domain
MDAPRGMDARGGMDAPRGMDARGGMDGSRSMDAPRSTDGSRSTDAPVSAPRGWGAPSSAGSAMHAEKRKPRGVGSVLGGMGAKPRIAMTLRFWAPALGALALAWPASASAATGTRPEGIAAYQVPASAGQESSLTLGFGSGYDSPQGSHAVRVLQRRLALGGDSPGPIDGRFGPLTRDAVMRFQASHGLLVDGIVGPQTWALSRSVAASRGLGQQGAAGLVRTWQRRLAAAGDTPGAIDGRFGPLTEQAVRRFQVAHGLRVNGIVGARTLALLSGTARQVAPRSRQPSRAPAEVARRNTPARPIAAPRPASKPSPANDRVTRPAASHRSGRLFLILAILAFVLTLIAALYMTEVAHRLWSAVHLPSPRRWRASRTSAAAPARQALTERKPPAQAGAKRELPAPAEAKRSVPAPAGAERKPPAPAEAKRSVPAEAGAERKPAAQAGARRKAPAKAPAQAGARGKVPAKAPAQAGAKRRAPAQAGAKRKPQPPPRPVRAATADQRQAAAARFRLGQRLEKNGDLRRAEAAFHSADELGHAAAPFHLGALLAHRGQTAEAEAAYHRADQRGHGSAASNLGVMLEERGAMAEAEAAYRRADQRGEAVAAFNLGALLEERGALGDASDAYRRAEQRGEGEVADAAHAALASLATREPTFAAG